MNTMLFTPISIGPVELPNRIAVPPMAMYSARSGVVQLFHKMHYGHLAASGAGLVCIESTAVSPDGRITNYDLGLWSDECEQGLKELVDLMHEIEPECRVMVQLNHAGRKASSVARACPHAAADGRRMACACAESDTFLGHLHDAA